jgi:hypothetical protein
MTFHDSLEPYVAAPARSATFHDLMASVGYLLFQWGLLDTSLDTEIAQLRRAGGEIAATLGRARTVNERLAEWRALLGRGRRRRAEHHAAIEGVAARVQEFHRLQGLIAAGFVAAAADDEAHGEPAIRCSHPASRHTGADDVRMTIRDILDTIDAMELCRSEMALLRGLGEH